MSDPGLLAQYGAVGLLAGLALFAVRVLFAKLNGAYEREKARADRLEEELRQMNELIRDQFVRSITQAATAVVDANRAVQSARREVP